MLVYQIGHQKIAWGTGGLTALPRTPDTDFGWMLDLSPPEAVPRLIFLTPLKRTTPLASGGRIFTRPIVSHRERWAAGRSPPVPPGTPKRASRLPVGESMCGRR